MQLKSQLLCQIEAIADLASDADGFSDEDIRELAAAISNASNCFYGVLVQRIDSRTDRTSADPGRPMRGLFDFLIPADGAA